MPFKAMAFVIIIIQKDLQFTCIVVKNPAGNSEPSPHNIVQKLHSKSLATVCSVRKKIK